MARQSGKPFQSLLIQYGLERFLYRLSQSSFKERFILKGGLLLTGMGIPHFSDISENFSAIMEKIRTFLHPVIKAIEKDARFEKSWPPGGPWQEVL